MDGDTTAQHQSQRQQGVHTEPQQQQREPRAHRSGSGSGSGSDGVGVDVQQKRTSALLGGMQSPPRTKRRLSVSALGSTLSTTSSSSTTGDRFIPERASVDYATAFLLAQEPFGSPKRPSAASASSAAPPKVGTGDDAVKEEAGRVYAHVLRNELFGPAYANTIQTTTTSNSTTTSTTTINNTAPPFTPSPRKLFQFRTVDTLKTTRRLDFFDSPASPKYSLSPIRTDSQRALLSPRKPPRHIAKVPFKVLDAPELADDFYLNLVDWSSTNLVSVGLGTAVYMWSACTSRVTKLCDLGPYDSVTSVNWIQRGTHLAVGTNRGTVQIWDAARCKKIRTMTGHTARVGALAWKDYVLTSGSRDRFIYHRDVRCQEHYMAKLSAHKQEVCGLRWNVDDNQLASGGNDNKLFVWDGMNTQPTLRFSDHSAAVKAIAWSPHQHGLLASGGGTADRKIRFWNTLTGTPLQCIDTGSQVCNLQWSKTSNELVSTHGYSQNQVVVWKYPSMQQIATLTGHTYRVLYLAMSPDGQTIVTGAGDETLRFWNVFLKSKEREETSVLANTTRSIR